MDIYESVFEEGRRRSIKRKDTGFSEHAGPKCALPYMYLTSTWSVETQNKSE